ncbi:hypothetical protein KDW_24080 [Dictyobacter vulcani]|uniref:Uncharacterized protein n=1 Tax=Dictyobacter vulcani TaxID=2607529 RepID=A0A5J4KSQ7_9CHLR|nr:hypothetical protein [Dictyobacter vulcani]GER88246.1 hypothetical protein KDW_24080 [Dictyobacter vulcani]
MDAFSDPQVSQLLYYAGGALILLPLMFAAYFYWQRVRKIHYLAEKHPEQEQEYHFWLLFGDYLSCSLLVFIATALCASLPLLGAVYLGTQLAQVTISLAPILLVGAAVGLLAGCYTTLKFLYAKTNYEESLLLPTM